MVACREPSARANESSIIASNLSFRIWHYMRRVVVFCPSRPVSNQRFRHFGSRPAADIRDLETAAFSVHATLPVVVHRVRLTVLATSEFLQ